MHNDYQERLDTITRSHGTALYELQTLTDAVALGIGHSIPDDTVEYHRMLKVRFTANSALYTLAAQALDRVLTWRIQCAPDFDLDP